MPQPLFRPLPGQLPLVQAELTALTYMLLMSNNEIEHAAEGIANDPLIPATYQRIAAWALGGVALENMQIMEEITFLMRAYAGVPYSRICPACDSILIAGGFCEKCNETIHA